VLRNKAIGLVKVQWTCYGPEDATWEHDQNMWEEYPQIILKKQNAKLHFEQLEFWNQISES
jgi:hypothetical protein